MKISRTVVTLGVVSFFNDMAAEMIYPLVPVFLTATLGAPITVVGFIEGIAEGTASLMKVVFGYISDRMQRRKPFVVAGYSFAAVSKFVISLVSVWPLVLFARVIDRLGKGLRTSPRDALLFENATKDNRGFIFGFHRSMDSAGAVVGPLVALLLLSILGENMRLIFLLACIPSIIGVFLVIVFVREKKDKARVVPSDQRTSFRDPFFKNVSLESFHFFVRRINNLNPRLKLFFLISIVFALGNSSDAFILLRAKDLGFSATFITLSYVLYNVSQTIFATPAGHVSDRIGSRKVFAGGLLVFSLVYLFFARIDNSFWIWFIFPFYGLYIAFTDGISKAYIADFISEKEAGTFFGIYQTAISLATFFASFIGGMLWEYVSPSATFYFGSIMALFAFAILFYGIRLKDL